MLPLAAGTVRGGQALQRTASSVISIEMEQIIIELIFLGKIIKNASVLSISFVFYRYFLYK